MRIPVLLLALGLFMFMPETPQDNEGRPPEDEENIKAGKLIYEARCAACHGMEGDGQGLAGAYMLPAPRDFTDVSKFKIRTTVAGGVPKTEDLFLPVSKGMPGTTMPAWEDVLSETERWQVIYYIETFGGEDWEEEAELEEDDLVKVPEPGGKPDKETIARGGEIYQKMKCWECHGQNGRGNGEGATTPRDKYGLWPRNLTRRDLFRGGRRVKDVARSIMTGLGGVAMPEYHDQFEKDEDILALTHYVLSLSEHQEKYPPSLEIQAVYTEEDIPDDPGDEFWGKTGGVRMKLSPQLTLPTRWQFASVDEVRVNAIYNGAELALRVEWDDRFRDAVHEKDDHEVTLASKSVALPTRKDLEVLRAKKFADGFSIQFPPGALEGGKKPHFAMGAPSMPVESWHYRADREGMKYISKGYFDTPDKMEKIPVKAKFEDGRWMAVFKIPIEGDGRFEPGKYLPIAFAAWDGGNGENGSRGSVSTWYWIVLEPKPSPMPYAYGGITFLLCGFMGIFFIRRIQKPGQGGTEES